MPNYNQYSYQYPQYGYQIPQQQTQLPQPQIQNGGLVSVHNENEARNYPIAIGTSITFKDENAPYVYTKTMGFSQLESPKFDKYRLIKEDASTPSNLPENDTSDAKSINTIIDDVINEIETIKEDIKGIKEKMKNASRSTNKKGEVDDE